MPFLGKDWRSDGDIWVRTAHGWETLKNWRVKIHENINYNVLQRLLRQSITQPEKNDELIECSQRSLFLHIPKSSPCRISTGQSNVMFTQAVLALDLAGAFKDHRRSKYVYKIMEILVKQRLLNISGAVQHQLFNLLEHALASAIETQRDKAQLVDLLEQLLLSLKEHQYCFKHMGSNHQWTKYYTAAIIMHDKARNIPITERDDDGSITLTELPYDVIRQILLYLCSQQDVINTGKTSPEMEALISDNALWRDLCASHFTRQQMQECLRDQCTSNIVKHINWYKTYNRLLRRYGNAERYADMVSMCPKCCVVFWKLAGHPCKQSQEDTVADLVDLTPEQFVRMFNV